MSRHSGGEDVRAAVQRHPRSDFGDRPLVGPGTELQLTIDDRAVPHDEVLAAVEVTDAEQVLTRAPARGEAREVGERLPLEEPENLYTAGQGIALRAASPSTRRQYIEEELQGAERSPRPVSLAGEYLTEAIDRLHDAGDPAYLYEHWRRFPPKEPKAEADKMRKAARRARNRAARDAVLFAAFAGEAYVNEFLAAHGVLEQWDRKPTPRKFLKGTAAAYGSPLFFTDREAYPVLVELYQLRDRLVHPKPGFGGEGIHFEASEDFESLFALAKIAEYIVMVGGAADLLVPRAYGMNQTDLVGLIAWRGRPVIRDYAQRNRRLPAWNARSERVLFRQAGDDVMDMPRWVPGPDHWSSRLRDAKENPPAHRPRSPDLRMAATGCPVPTLLVRSS